MANAHALDLRRRKARTLLNRDRPVVRRRGILRLTFPRQSAGLRETGDMAPKIRGGPVG